MAIALDINAFRDILFEGLQRLERLERTTKGRKQLAAEYRAEAKHLRETSGLELWRQGGGEMNSHVASPAELARRAIACATDLERQATELDAIKGENYSRWESY